MILITFTVKGSGEIAGRFKFPSAFADKDDGTLVSIALDKLGAEWGDVLAMSSASTFWEDKDKLRRAAANEFTLEKLDAVVIRGRTRKYYVK